MVVTWWEAEELVSHFEKYPELWRQDPDIPSSWIRYDRTTWDVGLQLTFFHTDSASPLRIVEVQVRGITWSEERTSAYFLTLLRQWTSYAIREDFVEFLRSLSSPFDVDSACIVLAYLHTVGSLSSLERTPHGPES